MAYPKAHDPGPARFRHGRVSISRHRGGSGKSTHRLIHLAGSDLTTQAIVGTRTAKGRALSLMRSPKSLLLTVLAFAGLGAPLAAAAPSQAFASRTLRLHEIAVHRYAPRTDGAVLERRYLLNSAGLLTHVEDVTVPASVTLPAEAFDKVLIGGAAWIAYEQLGPVAFANFELVTALPIMVADRMQFEVRASPDARLDGGKLVNISTRGIATAQDKLIAGFVVTELHRRVLVRAIGPTLGAFGLSGAMADPFFSIRKGGTPIYFNGNWSTRFDAAETINAAAQVGAFALPLGSKDAAMVVELEPGAYTVQVEPETGAGGHVLVEVYALP